MILNESPLPDDINTKDLIRGSRFNPRKLSTLISRFKNSDSVQHLGKGISRIAFRYEDTVIKVALDEYGLISNGYEADIMRKSSKCKLVPPLIDCDEKSHHPVWIQTKYIPEKLSVSEYESYFVNDSFLFEIVRHASYSNHDEFYDDEFYYDYIFGLCRTIPEEEKILEFIKKSCDEPIIITYFEEIYNNKLTDEVKDELFEKNVLEEAMEHFMDAVYHVYPKIEEVVDLHNFIYRTHYIPYYDFHIHNFATLNGELYCIDVGILVNDDYEGDDDYYGSSPLIDSESAFNDEDDYEGEDDEEEDLQLPPPDNNRKFAYGSSVIRAIKGSNINESLLTEAPIPDNWNKSKINKKNNSFTEIIAYCESKAKTIGQGSSRVAFIIDYQGRKTVLKFAKNKNGIIQNKSEIKVFKSLAKEFSDNIIPCIDYDTDENPLWIHLEYADTPLLSEINEIVFSNNFFAFISEIGLKNSGEQCYNKYIDYLTNEKEIKLKDDNKKIIKKMFDTVEYLFEHYHILATDFYNEENWGIFNNNLVIIDLGFDENVFKAMFKFN